MFCGMTAWASHFNLDCNYAVSGGMYLEIREGFGQLAHSSALGKVQAEESKPVVSGLCFRQIHPPGVFGVNGVAGSERMVQALTESNRVHNSSC